MDPVHVFCGTAAEYIKLAPVLHRLDAEQIPYRLIDSGQHASSSAAVRVEHGIREPDVRLRARGDVDGLIVAIRWLATMIWLLRSRRRLQSEVFGTDHGICVVHGDTLTTLTATLLARRAGLAVAHVESGLRSHSFVHPFPEELVRVAVMRRAAVLFPPDATAAANLRRMRGVDGDIVEVAANTIVETLEQIVRSARPSGDHGRVLMTLHRVENLHRRARLEAFVDAACTAARDWPVTFLLHRPTAAVIAREQFDTRLRDAGVELRHLSRHDEFVAALANAPFVITDGGSIQEEAAALGVPCLLWRARTERRDGVGENVVVSGYDPATVAAFLADPSRHRRAGADLSARPSHVIVAEVAARR